MWWARSGASAFHDEQGLGGGTGGRHTQRCSLAQHSASRQQHGGLAEAKSNMISGDTRRTTATVPQFVSCLEAAGGLGEGSPSTTQGGEGGGGVARNHL